eukprot:7709774-Pyramimonas_sp.AAC.1
MAQNGASVPQEVSHEAWFPIPISPELEFLGDITDPLLDDNSSPRSSLAFEASPSREGSVSGEEPSVLRISKSWRAVVLVAIPTVFDIAATILSNIGVGPYFTSDFPVSSLPASCACSLHNARKLRSVKASDQSFADTAPVHHRQLPANASRVHHRLLRVHRHDLSAKAVEGFPFSGHHVMHDGRPRGDRIQHARYSSPHVIGSHCGNIRPPLA